MFDKFTPLLKVEKRDFVFQPSRYEVWKDDRVVGQGLTSSPVVASIVAEDGEKMAVTFDEPELKDEILAVNTFDEFVTGSDRYQLVIIPEITNAHPIAARFLKEAIGYTREEKQFSPQEPCFCNIFLRFGKIKRIQFYFASPKKLIELYE